MSARSSSFLAASLGILLASTAASAAAAPHLRLDHRDQSSISVSPGYEHLIISGRSEKRSITEPGAFTDLSFGLPGGVEGGQGFFGIRVGMGSELGERLAAPYVGYRSFAGDWEWKTFFDVSAFGRILPIWGVGARIGAGVQRELSQHVGIFFSTGGSVAGGDGLQVGYDLGIGLQLRFGEPGAAGPRW